MRNLLSTLTALIKELLNSGKEPPYTHAQWAVLVHKECLDVEDVLVADIFTIKDDGKVKLYIESHQLVTVRFLEDLCAILLNHNDVGKVSLLKIVAQQMIQHFLWIEKQYPRYFNSDAPVEDACKEFTRQYIAGSQVFIEDGLRVKNVAPALVDIVMDYLRALESPGRHRIEVLSELLYLIGFADNMKDFAQDSRTAVNWSDELTKNLIYLNFNTPEAYQYCDEWIRREANEESDPAEKLKALGNSRRYLLLLPVKERTWYHAGAVSLRENLAGHLKEEMNYLERLQDNALFLMSQDSPPQSPDTIEVSFSKSQLAFLTRVMIETGVVTTKPAIAVYRFITRRVRTKGRKSQLSTGSFKNSTYKPAPYVVASVKKTLFKMINYIQKHYRT